MRPSTWPSPTGSTSAVYDLTVTPVSFSITTAVAAPAGSMCTLTGSIGALSSTRRSATTDSRRVPGREALPEDLVRPLARRRLGTGPREHGSHGRRDREDVVAEPVQDGRLLDADRDSACRPRRARRRRARGSMTRRKKRGWSGSGPATCGASGGVCGSTSGGQGSDTVRRACGTASHKRGRAEPADERPPAQRRCSIGTSVADSGSSLTGVYVMPSNFAK